MKKILFGDNAIEKILEGVDILNAGVSSTLGPQGSNVVIKTIFNNPHSTKDGVTVAQHISSDDHAVNTGITMVKQAASKTAQEAGDGTTTSTILAHRMIHNGFDLMVNKDERLLWLPDFLRNLLPEQKKKPLNVNELKRGMNMAKEEIVELIKKYSTPLYDGDTSSQKTIDTNKLINVATISANNDLELGKLIGGTMAEIGLDGQISVEKSGTLKTSVDKTKGYKFEKGYDSPYLINEPRKGIVDYNNCRILLIDHVLENFNDIIDLLNKCMMEDTPLLIIAEDVIGDARSTIIKNAVSGKLRCGVTTTPAIKNLRQELLEDISTFTGAKIISKYNGQKIKNARMQDLGYCDRFTISKESTTIFGFGLENESERQKAILERVENINVDLKDDMIEEDRITQLRDRKSRLLIKAVTLKVGASTEVELKEKMDRIDDAIRSTRSAMEEGIVPGAGSIYMKIFRQYRNTVAIDGDKGIGRDIVYQSLTSIHNELFGSGNNARNILGNDGDLMANGVIDAAKVIRSALENATSVASTILTTKCLIVETDV